MLCVGHLGCAWIRGWAQCALGLALSAAAKHIALTDLPWEVKEKLVINGES